MKYTGIELLQAIKDGKVKAGTEIKEYYIGLPTKHKMKVTENNLIWKPGEFYVGELWDDDYKFEVIGEEKEIEKLSIQKSMKKNYGVDYLLTHQEFCIQEKINELVREVNKLRKNQK